MTRDQALGLLERYSEEAREQEYSIRWGLRDQLLDHVANMPSWIHDGHSLPEVTQRLGYAQGVMVATGVYTLDEVKEHSREVATECPECKSDYHKMSCSRYSQRAYERFHKPREERLKDFECFENAVDGHGEASAGGAPPTIYRSVSKRLCAQLGLSRCDITRDERGELTVAIAPWSEDLRSHVRHVVFRSALRNELDTRGVLMMPKVVAHGTL